MTPPPLCESYLRERGPQLHPRARLVRHVREVALRVQVGVRADHTDRLLVRADRAVGPKPPKDALLRAVGLRAEIGPDLEARVRDVVGDADDELVLAAAAAHVVEHRLGVARRVLLRREAKLAAEHADLAEPAGLGEGRRDVEVERVAERAVLARAVEHGDLLDRRRQRLEELPSRPRPVEAHLHHTDALALRVEHLARLLGRLGRRAHHDNHLLGLWMTDVLHRLVVSARHRADAVHGRLYDIGASLVVLVSSDRVLEENVGALARAANGRRRRVEREVAQVLLQRFLVDEVFDDGVRDHVDLLHLGRRAIAVEEVHERDARLDGREVRDEREVHHLLHRMRAELRHAGLAARHHVRMVVEDGERMFRDRARGDMDHARHQLASDEVQVRDHEQQALAGGERAAERAPCQRAVHGARGPCFRLHRADVDDLAETVHTAARAPRVHVLTHRSGWGDGIDERRL